MKKNIGKVKSGKYKVERKTGYGPLFTFHFPCLPTGTALSTDSGFTLVETLVAIAILMIAIAGPLTVAEKGLSASIYARDQLTGSYLAQDAMEYIKNVVDTDQLNSSNADTNITNPADWWLVYQQNYDLASCTKNQPCMIDTYLGGLIPCNGSTCWALNLTSQGYEQSCNGSPSCNLNLNPNITNNQTTTFTRTFYLQPFSTAGDSNCVADSSCNAANVIVTVTWPGDVVGGGGVMLEDTLFNTPIQ